MSSKKVSEKETKTVAKKASAKPSTKAAAKPAKETEKKSSAKAKDSEKKPAAKTATASAAKKAAPKASAKDTKATAAKSEKVEKAPAKAASKSKASAKTEKATKATSKATAKSDKTEKANKADKVEKDVKEVKDSKESKAKAPKDTNKGNKATDNKTDAAESNKVEPTAEKKPDTTVNPPKKPANDYDYAVLLEGVKKLSKSIMFVEVDEQEDRSNKKKMSSEMKNLDMKPTASIRHKASLAEETQEELTERILKELEEQNKAFEREAATQMCTRCNRNLVSPEFWVDKHLGYCEECAAILKLGQSKEARKVEYQLGSMGGDSLDEEDDEIVGPDADDLKEAEEDLAEMED